MNILIAVIIYLLGGALTLLALCIVAKATDFYFSPDGSDFGLAITAVMAWPLTIVVCTVALIVRAVALIAKRIVR